MRWFSPHKRCIGLLNTNVFVSHPPLPPQMHEMGEEYRRELRSMLVRMSCIEHDFIVRHRSFTSMPSDMLEESGDALRRTLGEGASGGTRRG